MRTSIQRALNIEVGDKWFFSNHSRIRSGERSQLGNSRIVREVLMEPKGAGKSKYLYLSTTGSPLSVSMDLLLEKYSPNLDTRDTALNRAQKVILLLSFYGFIEEARELLVQGNI